MTTTLLPDYFERLGLDARADARAVRTAYARQLKLIDQEADGVAFQSLREAYEGALRELNGGTAPPLLTPTTAPDRVTPATPISHVQPRGEDVPALMRQVHGALSKPRYDEGAMQQHLQELLRELRPLNLADAEAFEAGVAGILNEGWRTGHELLFAAAWREFAWDAANLPRYLGQFRLLEGAIHDLRFLHEQPEAQREVYQRVIAALRAPGDPEPAQLARDITAADHVVQTFPDLVAVVSEPAKVAQWRVRMSAILAQVQAEADARPEVKAVHPMQRAMYYVYGCMALLFCLAMLDMNFDILGLHPRNVPVLSVKETQHITRQFTRMDIKTPVEFKVTINEAGQVEYMERFDSSGASFDATLVEAAIRGAAPYPADYPRQFRVRLPL